MATTIAEDLDEYWIVLDPEFIMTENPEVIFFAAWEDMLGLTGYYVDNYEGAMQFRRIGHQQNRSKIHLLYKTAEFTFWMQDVSLRQPGILFPHST